MKNEPRDLRSLRTKGESDKGSRILHDDLDNVRGAKATQLPEPEERRWDDKRRIDRVRSKWCSTLYIAGLKVPTREIL
jgi:hypothetical protein